MARKRRVSSIADELLYKSREAALSAVQIFNNPLIMFKSETFIVLMIIAWTYLHHAYYRKQGVEYRYFDQKDKRRKFEKTLGGAYKYWSLKTCLDYEDCPIDKDTRNNLRFLLGIRHEVEHQMTMGLDEYIGGRLQASVLNYNKYMKHLFGERYGIDKYLSYSLQFLELSYEQISQADASLSIPPKLKAYILEFDTMLSEEEFNHEAYSFRLYFSKKLVNRPGQADRVVEFVAPDSELAQSIEKQYWVKKEVERPKLLPRDIVEKMKAEGFIKFKIQHNTQLWQKLDAKKNGKGFGIIVSRTWYWYESWLGVVRQHCEENRDIYT